MQLFENQNKYTINYTINYMYNLFFANNQLQYTYKKI
jgi:hypothetical protein